MHKPQWGLKLWVAGSAMPRGMSPPPHLLDRQKAAKGTGAQGKFVICHIKKSLPSDWRGGRGRAAIFAGGHKYYLRRQKSTDVLCEETNCLEYRASAIAKSLLSPAGPPLFGGESVAMDTKWYPLNDSGRWGRAGNRSEGVALCSLPWLLCSPTLHLHAQVAVGVVELHVVAGLDPTHHPGVTARDRRHEDASGGAEIGRSVAQHDGRCLLDGGGSRLDGGRHVVDHDVLPAHPRLARHALQAAHSRAGPAPLASPAGAPHPADLRISQHPSTPPAQDHCSIRRLAHIKSRRRGFNAKRAWPPEDSTCS